MSGPFPDASYAVVLRACSAAAKPAVVRLLSRALGIKDATSEQVVDSAPIVLIGQLSRDHAAVLALALHGLRLAGAELEIGNGHGPELPKIDWPKQPPVFKQDLDELTSTYAALDLSLPHGERISLIDLLIPLVGQRQTDQRETGSGKRETFTGSDLGEITPFSNPVLPPADGPGHGSANGAQAQDGDLLSRMNELFPDEDNSLVPDSASVTNILDRLLPDEAAGGWGSSAGRAAVTGAGSGSGRQVADAGHAAGSFAVFLAKIADENRRKKAVPVLAELCEITPEEAEALSRKVIIPVLKAVSKDDAERAKHRFAEIGVLARVRAN